MSMLLPWYAMWRQSQKEYRQPSVQSAPLRPVMLVLPKGKFLMGSPANDADSLTHERPQHEVEIRQGFAMSETEVTQEQYQAVMGNNPSHFKDRKNWQQHPVEKVSWLDAVEYCNKLSEAEEKEPCYQIEDEQVKWAKGLACKGYRLPTESEWEYAARAEEGTTYSGSNRAEDVGWFGEELETGSTHEVKGKKPNQWGLYDMSGNVWEWVWDVHSGGYKEGVQVDPTGPLVGGSDRVSRGGSWNAPAGRLRVAARGWNDPGSRFLSQGFRLSRSYP
jgi:formylglycine-generating enzyme required for sulfatase activity